MLELVALDCGAAGPEPQDRFRDHEHELAVSLEQVALAADPLGDGLGDVIDFHAALLAEVGQDAGHVRGGPQQPRHHFGLVGTRSHLSPDSIFWVAFRPVRRPRSRKAIHSRATAACSVSSSCVRCGRAPQISHHSRTSAAEADRAAFSIWGDLRCLASGGGGEGTAGQPTGQPQIAELAAQALPGSLEAGRRRRHRDQSKARPDRNRH